MSGTKQRLEETIDGAGGTVIKYPKAKKYRSMGGGRQGRASSRLEGGLGHGHNYDSGSAKPQATVQDETSCRRRAN